MRSLMRGVWVAAALLALLPALAPAAAEMGPRGRRFASAEDGGTARVVVKYRSDSTLMRVLSAPSAAPAGGAAPTLAQPLHATALGARIGIALQDRHVLGSRTQSLQAQGIGADELARRLAALPDVEWAEPVRRQTIRALVPSVLPNDPYFGPAQTTITPAVGQWYLRKPDSTFVAAIDAVGGWATTLGVASVTVAVLDTGVRFDHPDFANADGSSKLYPGYDFISRTANSADGNGVDADASDPGDWNAAGDCGSGSAASSSSWHGTQTAGIIGAATDNALGMASVGRNVMLLPVRVLGKCGGYDDDIIAGMRWAAGLSNTPVVNQHPAKVISMSLGSTAACTAAANNQKYIDVFSEMATAGVTVVVAAGNDEGLAVGLPADCPGALAVGAVRHTGTKVGFSNVGPEVAISAPGGNCVNTSGTCLYPILTTLNAGTTTPTTSTYSNGTAYSVGTSFAAPMVAGAVGLMLSVDPTLTPAAIRSALQTTARPFPTGGGASTILACRAPSAAVQDECYCTTSTCGAGMLDVSAAVAAVVPKSVAAPSALITPSNTTPFVGMPVTLSSAGSSANAGRNIVAWQWQVTAGGTLAAFTAGATDATATLLPGAAGSITVQLTVTDSAGAVGTQSIVLQAQPVPPPTVSITASSTSPAVGSAVTLVGSGSTASGGRTIASYQWQLTAASGVAAFVGATNGATATLQASAAGSATVQLTVTDSSGASATQTLALTVQAQQTATAAGGSGGGGALSAGWLALLALATAALKVRPRRAAQSAPRTTAPG